MLWHFCRTFPYCSGLHGNSRPENFRFDRHPVPDGNQGHSPEWSGLSHSHPRTEMSKPLEWLCSALWKVQVPTSSLTRRRPGAKAAARSTSYSSKTTCSACGCCIALAAERLLCRAGLEHGFSASNVWSDRCSSQYLRIGQRNGPPLCLSLRASTRPHPCSESDFRHHLPGAEGSPPEQGHWQDVKAMDGRLQQMFRAIQCVLSNYLSVPDQRPMNFPLAVELLRYGHVEVRARVARSNFVFVLARLAVYQGGLLSYFSLSGQRSSRQTHSVSSSGGVDRSEYGHAASSYDHLSHRECLQGVVGRGLG